MKRKLEIKYSREDRVNDHSISRYTLYCNNKAIYYAQYRSCVINYINEKFATKSQAKLKKKMERLAEKHGQLGRKIWDIQQTLNKPLVKVEGE